MSNCIVIGDIHGQLSMVRSLLEHIPKEDCKLVFTGDYINYGKDSKEVIDYLIEIKNMYDCVFISGNHEENFINYIENHDLFEYLNKGGIESLLSYVDKYKNDIHHDLLSKIPEEHITFFNNLLTEYKYGNYRISHRGRRGINNFDQLLDSSKENNFTIICGHFLQKNKDPYISDKVICLDTGCGVIDGPLTAISIDQRLIYKLIPKSKSIITIHSF